MLVERGAGVVLRQDAFEARVVALDRDHGVVDDLADGRAAWRCSGDSVQRAAGGTQKTFSAWYSSGSSGLAPAYSPLPATSLAWCSSKVSEMYLRKMRPRTTCLYSAASMLLRSLSAASQSLASKPMLAEVFFLAEPARGMRLRQFFIEREAFREGENG